MKTIRPQRHGEWTTAGGELSWRVTDEGIETTAPHSPRRLRKSAVNTHLAGEVCAKYGDIIATHAAAFRVSQVLIATTLVVESGGNPKAERYEKHRNDHSIGVAQTLTATAYAIARMRGVRTKSELRQTVFPTSPEVLKFALPDKSWPAGGSLTEWREYLGTPWNSIMLCAALHAYNRDLYAYGDCPVFAYAAYNAGSPRPSSNEWGLVAADKGLAITTFANHFYWAKKAWRQREEGLTGAGNNGTGGAA